MGGALDAVAAFWDEVVSGALTGGEPHRNVAPLARWFAGYAGRGRGVVDLNATPEPYIGPLATRFGEPRLIALGLNPGPADLRFQGRGGVFAAEYERLGGFSAWAVSEPYLRDPWRTAHGRNRYHENLRRFARHWLEDPTIRSRDVLVFELYPWHSDAATAAMTPDPDLIEEFVWRPIAETGVEKVIAIGADWQRVAERLSLPALRLEVQFTDPTRRARSFELPSGQRLVVTWHQASNSPPNAPDTRALRDSLRGPPASPSQLPSQIRPHPIRTPRSSARRQAGTSGRSHPCTRFWEQLTARFTHEQPGWKLGAPRGNDYPLFSPLPDARIKCNFSRQGLRVELLLQSDDGAKNLDRLAVLEANLPQLQAAFGDQPQLRLERLDGKTQARLATYRAGSIDAHHEWSLYLSWFCATTSRLADALAANPAIGANWPS